MLKRTQGPTSTRIEFDDGHVVADVTIVRGSLLHGLARDKTIAEMVKLKTDDLLFYAAAVVMYPCFVAVVKGSITIDGQEIPWPPNVNTFANDLPDELMAEIMAEVYVHNGHWTPKESKTPLDVEKKMMLSVSSKTSTAPHRTRKKAKIPKTISP
jgi:hypothetical protein